LVVVPSSAVTIIVIIVSPTSIESPLLAVPEFTETPLTLIVA
jgi:hypothetical protein